MTTLLSRDQTAAAGVAAFPERDTIRANLLELDNRFGKRLLARATVTGGTPKRWDAAAVTVMVTAAEAISNEVAGELQQLGDQLARGGNSAGRTATGSARLLDGNQARAARLGCAEDTDLDARYARARGLLWAARCDLSAATAAVTGYQQAVLALSERGRRP
jgi:hypothetical protein